MLISPTMTALRMCPSCKKHLDASKFHGRRKLCKTCKNSARAKVLSASYEEYLRNLYSQSKSANRPESGNSRDLEWEISADDLIALWEKQDGKCALSGVYLTHHKDGSGRKEYNASIDRISPEKNYTPENIQLVCFRVNILKHTLSEDMFYWWIKTIHDFSCD